MTSRVNIGRLCDLLKSERAGLVDGIRNLWPALGGPPLQVTRAADCHLTPLDRQVSTSIGASGPEQQYHTGTISLLWHRPTPHRYP